MTASPLSQSDLDTIKEQFERDGLFHVRGLLSEAEADHYARLIDEKLVTHGTGQRFMSNGPNEFPEFWPLITHPKLVEVLRHVLGPDLRYVQAGDLHANHNAHHWHRDLFREILRLIDELRSPPTSA